MPKCELCSEPNVGPEHDFSEKHKKNETLYKIATSWKKYAGNRDGVVVQCNVRSERSNITDYMKPKIKISAKPSERIKYDFILRNDTKKEDMLIIGINLAHDGLGFELIDSHRPDERGDAVRCLEPKIQINVSVMFASPRVGQYGMPIIFHCRKKSNGKDVFIVRDMVVFVEETVTIHEKIKSPYAQQEVNAEVLIPSTVNRRNLRQFPLTKDLKNAFNNGLVVGEKMTTEEKKTIESMRKIFDIGVTKENYTVFFHKLLWYEETITRKHLKKYNMSNVPMKYVAPWFILDVQGLNEKRPSLIIGNLLFIRPHDNEEVMFEGVIKEINQSEIMIEGVDERIHNFPCETYDVRFFLSRLVPVRMHQAVESVFAHDQGPRVFPEKNTKLPAIVNLTHFYNKNVERNPEQRTAVEHIVSGSSGRAPYMIHGPPGTGKTVTVVEAILQLVKKNPNSRVMVCADSNMAADHVGVQLVEYANLFPANFLLRANSVFRVWETMRSCLHPYSNGTTKEEFKEVSIAKFRKYNVVITTLSHAAKYAGELKKKSYSRHITHLFIDEAAQASEPACLIPVCGLLRSSGLLVLAGDPLQLGPVVISHDARNKGLGLSLMERLKARCYLYSDKQNDPNYIVMLKNNFRSDPDILQLSNEIFYSGQLKALAKEDKISRVDILGEQFSSRAIVFHAVVSKEQKMGKSPSFFNSMEMEVVQKYIKALITTHHVNQDDIGIIAPYIRQVCKIKQWLLSEKYDNIEVGSVEAFQGKEKRLIIISTVRATCGLLDHDAKYKLGFLVDDKRFNVALTRAKAKVIVIGSPLCLSTDTKWLAYIQKCQELGTYHGYEMGHEEQIKKDIIDRLTPLFNNLKISNKGEDVVN